MLHTVADLREAVALWAHIVESDPALVRTVLVPSERLAHAFRRELALDKKLRPLLIGTRLVQPVEVAHEWLLHAGEAPIRGAEEIRSVALENLFAAPDLETRLRYFDVREMRKGSGYAEAFAATLGDLAAAGVGAGELRKASAEAKDEVSSRRCNDVAEVLAALKLDACDDHQILRRAAAPGKRDRGLVFALLTSEPGEDLIAFLSSIAGATVALLASAPERAEIDLKIARLGAALGGVAPAKLAEKGADSELAILREGLFRPAADRAVRGKGPDGTVHFEWHAGVEEELAAAADWVAEQVRNGVPLERVAVIVPQADPLAGMVHDRLAKLPWEGLKPPLHVAGGLPAATIPVGQRMDALLRALECGLRAEEFLRLLPSIRLEKGADGNDRTHLSASGAGRLICTCGTPGGSPERIADAREWVAGLEKRIAQLAALAGIAAPGDRQEREVAQAKRELVPFREVLPAIRDLTALAERVAAGEPLSRIWPALEGFWKSRVIAMDDVGYLPDLSRRLQSLLSFDRRGTAALRTIRRCAEGIRWSVGRFGEPRVFIGTLEQAAGIPFDSVRVVGLAEGAIAGSPVEDPLLPDLDRRRIDGMSLAAHRPAAELRGLCRVVRHTCQRLVLSAPRQTVDGTVREPSIVFLEAAAVLRRPHAVTGAPTKGLPDADALRRDYFDSGRHALKALPRLQLERPSTADLAAFTEALYLPGPGPLDGRFAATKPEVRICSPSGLQKFMECPHRFLFEKVFHWEEPDAIPDSSRIDTLVFGSLFHAVMESFFKARGAEFYAHQSSLDAWTAEAQRVGDAEFDSCVGTYPLGGGETRLRERRRLREAIERAVKHEWERGPGIAVARVEEPFGWRGDCIVGGLPVRGAIDRVETVPEGTSVRDFKSGKAHPRQAGDRLDPVTDIQLAIYACVVRGLATAWKVPPPARGAYVYATAASPRERDFSGAEFEGLMQAGESWAGLARRLMEEGSYPRTSRKDDCRNCPFVPVCGRTAPLKTESRWPVRTPAVSEFLLMKAPVRSPEPEEGEGPAGVEGQKSGPPKKSPADESKPKPGRRRKSS